MTWPEYVALVFVLALVSFRVWRFVGRDVFPGERLREWIEGRATDHEKEASRIAHEVADYLARTDAEAIEYSERREADGERDVKRHKRSAGRWWKALELVTCPWCLGSWVSFVVVAVTAQVTSVPQPALAALAVAATVGLIGGMDG